MTLAVQPKQKRGYYVDAALEDACAILQVNMDGLLTGGYRIYTAMGTGLQQKCEELFAREDLFPAKDCQAAIAIQRTDCGLVAALVGGRGEDGAMAFNRAEDIRRQPGSVIKHVLVYGPALEEWDIPPPPCCWMRPQHLGIMPPEISAINITAGLPCATR